jgi:dephospho-CoA kinase
MLVIGLTGGIGSGKTTVANMFADRGIPVIDADIIAREVTQPDTTAYLKIINHFGEEILHDDGTLNRAMLRNLVFQDINKRRWLEDLLHPIIIDGIAERLKKVTSAYCIVVIPLLLETGPYPFIDRILVIDAPEHLQIERVVTRDNAVHQEVKSILDAQASRVTRLARADDVITNDGNLDHLIQQIDQLDAKYAP